MIAMRLDNIDVICTEIEPMRAFYADLLGLPLRLPYEPGQGWVGLRAGDVVIYLIEDDAATLPPHPAPRFTGGANPPGFDSFAFEVAELDAAIADLERWTPTCSEHLVTQRELAQACRMARHGAWRLAAQAGGPAPSADELEKDRAELVAEQEACWLLRSRPGGLADSLRGVR